MATEPDEQGVTKEERSTPAVEQPGQPGDAPDGEQDPKTYDEEYVKGLRDEAAAARVKAKRADAAEERLRTLAITDAARSILTDPTDLLWSEAMADEDGWPDPDKIRTAAEQLCSTKPHLGRPSGDIGQGRHSEEDNAVNLAELLKAGA